jgi:hypothetical protein
LFASKRERGTRLGFKLKKVRFLRGCRKKYVGGVERKIMVKKMLRS